MGKKSKSENKEVDLKEILKGIIEVMGNIVETLEEIKQSIDETHDMIKENLEEIRKQIVETRVAIDQIDGDLVSFRKMVWVQYNGKQQQSGRQTYRRSYRRRSYNR